MYLNHKYQFYIIGYLYLCECSSYTFAHSIKTNAQQYYTILIVTNKKKKHLFIFIETNKIKYIIYIIIKV